jgi:hypothetical protein
MLVPVQVLESHPPTPLVVVAVVVPDRADQAVAADLILLYQVVTPILGFTTFFPNSTPQPIVFSAKKCPTQKNCQKLDTPLSRP